MINYHPPKVHPVSCAFWLVFFLLGILLGIISHFFTQLSQKMIHAGAATSHLPIYLPRHGKELRNINFLTGGRTDSSSVQKPGWSFQFRRVILPSSIRPIISHQVRIPINQPVQRDGINVSDVGQLVSVKLRVTGWLLCCEEAEHPRSTILRKNSGASKRKQLVWGLSTRSKPAYQYSWTDVTQFFVQICSTQSTALHRKIFQLWGYLSTCTVFSPSSNRQDSWEAEKGPATCARLLAGPQHSIAGIQTAFPVGLEKDFGGDLSVCKCIIHI